MKNFLQDLVAHTHSLGVLPIIRVTATPESTSIDSVSEDRKIILNATTHTPIQGIDGVFGMPNLNKLDLHLKCPEYKENAVITLSKDIRDGKEIPVGIHFQNESGDFQNDYRFMSRQILDIKMKAAQFLGTTWDVEFSPTQTNITRFKYQSAAHTEETMFQVSSQNDNLIFSFGDLNTHAGNFVFQAGINGKLKNTWSWPKSEVISVLNLDGDKTVRISDLGALQITVDSGITVYNYTLQGHR